MRSILQPVRERPGRRIVRKWLTASAIVAGTAGTVGYLIVNARAAKAAASPEQHPEVIEGYSEEEETTLNQSPGTESTESQADSATQAQEPSKMLMGGDLGGHDFPQPAGKPRVRRKAKTDTHHMDPASIRSGGVDGTAGDTGLTGTASIMDQDMSTPDFAQER